MRSGLKESCRRSSSRLQRVRRAAGAYLLAQPVVRAGSVEERGRFGIKGGAAFAGEHPVNGAKTASVTREHQPRFGMFAPGHFMVTC
jgi:hypothetical protein